MPKPKKTSPFNTFAEAVEGKQFVFFGCDQSWIHEDTVKRFARKRGVEIADKVSAGTDILVVGPAREKGRAAAIKKAESLRKKGGNIQTLNLREYAYVMRPDLSGKTFAFTGGFAAVNQELINNAARLLANAGATVADSVDDSVDILVVGEGRAKGKTATVRQFEERQTDDSSVFILAEHRFVSLIACQQDPADTQGLDLAGMLVHFRAHCNEATERKLGRAIKMLQKDAFQLYCDVQAEHVAGVVRSQTSDSVYSVWLKSNGSYYCTDTELDSCMGMQGGICKHLLVLLVGLCRNEGLAPEQTWAWLQPALSKRPLAEDELNTLTLLRYKGVEAGEVDWRPTETTPEDYYAY